MGHRPVSVDLTQGPDPEPARGGGHHPGPPPDGLRDHGLSLRPN